MANLIETIEKIAKHFSYGNILDEIDVIKEFKTDFQGIDLVVMGRFKAGKSSMLNTLLKRNFLPTGVLPVTAIITRISYGEIEKAIVITLSGESFEIDIENLTQYVTEKNNPHNEKGVFLVDIFTPAMNNFRNIRFIDTPGLGSAFKHNTEVTQKWYNRIGAAIVVINSTQACSEDDHLLVASALEHSPIVFVVLSKTDMLNKTELPDVVNFVTNRIKKTFKKNLNIFTYSIKNALNISYNNIVNEVIIPINNNHSNIKQSIFNHKLNHLKALTVSYLNISLNVRKKEESERHELKDKIIDEQLRLNYVQRELRLIAQSYLDNVRKTLEKIVIENKKVKLTEKMLSDFDTHFDTWRGNLNKVSRHYEQWLKNSTEKYLREIENETRESANKLAAQAGRHFTNYCKSFGNRLNQNLIKILGVSMPEDDFSMEVKPVEKPDIMTSWAFESHIDLLWFIIPMFLFRKYFKKHFRKQLPVEAEKNLYRLTAQLTKNINNSIETSHKKSIDYITSQLNSMEKLLSEKSHNSSEVFKYLKDITNNSTVTPLKS